MIGNRSGSYVDPVEETEVEETPIEEAPVDAAVTEGEEPIEAPEDESEDYEYEVPGLPGQRNQQRDAYSAQEVAALQAYVQQAAAQMQQYKQQLQQYELGELSEEERAQAYVRQQAEELQAREAQLNDWYAKNQWYSYYNQWVPEGTIQGEDPVAWQHSALSYLYQENQELAREAMKLRKEVDALRKVGQAPAAPKITTQGGVAVPKKNLWDMSWEEMQAIKDAALLGTLGSDEYPGV